MCPFCGLPGVAHEGQMPRRAFMFGAAVVGTLTAAASASASEMWAQKQEQAPPKPENVMTPDAALTRLMDGNKRYQEGVARRHDFIGIASFEFAVECSDMRHAAP
jgi:carbonic anhydrase